MADPVSDDARITAEIERLKVEFPKTRDLYREVCALLFFRFGITPTANRLYQFVHRGSMGTPTAVLSEFWADLREKSRVRIEHPDLPAEVRQAAGELVSTLWSHATTAANAALDGLRADVEAQQRDAQQSVAALRGDLARTETALEQRTSALLSAQVRIHELEQSLAAADAARAALDDERAANAQLQRDVETAAQALADARTERQTLQKQLGDLRHRNGSLEGQLEAIRGELNAWRGAGALPVTRSRPADATKARSPAKGPKVATKIAKTAKVAKGTRQAGGTPVAGRAARKDTGGASGPRSGS